MIVVMHSSATAEQIREVEERVRQFGFDIHSIYGVERTVIRVLRCGDPGL